MNGFGQIVYQTPPQFTSSPQFTSNPQFKSNSMTVELTRATFPYQASREVEEPTRQTSVSPEDPAISGGSGSGMSIERFYCQEYDCGKGFSSKTHLESHTRFFHPKKVRIIVPSSGTNTDIYG